MWRTRLHQLGYWCRSWRDPSGHIRGADDHFIYSGSGKERDPDSMSERFIDVMKRIAAKKHWTADTFDQVQQITLRYKEGMTTSTHFDPFRESSPVSEIEMLYNWGSDECTSNMLYYSDWNGTEIIVNMREISLIGLPLDKVEETVCTDLLDE